MAPNIIAAERIYEDLADGRTVLVAAEGDEINEATAARLGIGADGKAPAGSAQPPTELRPTDGSDVDTPPPGTTTDDAGTPAAGLQALNAKDAVAAASDLGADAAAAELAAERNGKNRKTVIEALEARQAAIAETAGEGGE